MDLAVLLPYQSHVRLDRALLHRLVVLFHLQLAQQIIVARIIVARGVVDQLDRTIIERIVLPQQLYHLFVFALVRQTEMTEKHVRLNHVEFAQSHSQLPKNMLL